MRAWVNFAVLVVCPAAAGQDALSTSATPFAPATAECLSGPMAGLEIHSRFSRSRVAKVLSDEVRDSSVRFVHFLPKVDARDGVEYVAMIPKRSGKIEGIWLTVRFDSDDKIAAQIELIRNAYARAGFPSIVEDGYEFFHPNGLYVTAWPMGRGVLYKCQYGWN